MGKMPEAQNFLIPPRIMTDLQEIGLKGRLPIFVQNFLSNREFKVRVGSTLSEAHNQEQGVPQGSILSVTVQS